MYKDAWALRAVEAAYAGALVTVALAFVNAGIGTHACSDFAAWWAARAEGMFAIEIYEITTELPHLNRGDLPLPLDLVETAPAEAVPGETAQVDVAPEAP